MAKRPYDDPANTNPDGSRILSENAWDQSESARDSETGDVSWGIDLAEATEHRVTKKEVGDIVHTLLEMIEKKADRSSLDTLWRASESRFATRQVEEAIGLLSARLDAVLPAGILESLNILSSQIDALKAGVIAHTQKMDADFAAQNLAVAASSLDEDYASSLTI